MTFTLSNSGLTFFLLHSVLMCYMKSKRLRHMKIIHVMLTASVNLFVKRDKIADATSHETVVPFKTSRYKIPAVSCASMSQLTRSKGQI